jgi:hypothetical protein
MNDLDLDLLHCTGMCDPNYTKSFILTWNLNISLNVFIHFSEEIVSKLHQSIYWTDTIFKIKTRIKSIQKILTVFQYPHLIEAIT